MVKELEKRVKNKNNSFFSTPYTMVLLLEVFTIDSFYALPKFTMYYYYVCICVYVCVCVRAHNFF